MLGLLFKLSAITIPLIALLNDNESFNTLFSKTLLARPKSIGLGELRSKQWDFIVVGAGSAGAVVANRLSEDPNSQVLLLEAGGHENTITDMPITGPLAQRTKLDWIYSTVPQNQSCFGFRDRRSFWPRGKVLGGTSVLNSMMYIRGNRNDFDLWPKGWQWDDVFPYFLKSENNHDDDIRANGFHSNQEGYLDVSRQPYVTDVARIFIESGKEIGYKHIQDFNGPSQTGFAVPQTTNRNGSRCSTAKAFLYPVYERHNLQILTSAMVTKVLFNEDKRAIGVTFDRDGKSHSVFANKEVILSGGAVNSPQLLMLSGVGPAEHLQQLGIPVVADLPVGLNLHDQVYASGVTFAIDKPASVRINDFTKSIVEYFTNGTGVLSLSGVDGMAFVNTKYASKKLDWPDIQFHLNSYTAPIGQLFLKGNVDATETLTKYYKPFDNKNGFQISPILLRPESRGYVKLSSTNPYEKPLIDPMYFSHPQDIKTAVEGMKIAYKVGLSEEFKSKLGARPITEEPMPGCESHEFLSDAYLECHARTNTQTIYHPVGTCKMADDPSGVVDSELRVKGGVSGLRVADASVMPRITNGNTNAPTIMIGERAADFIKLDWSLTDGDSHDQ